MLTGRPPDLDVVRKMKNLIPLSALVLLLGCQTIEREPGYSLEDKKLSMSDVELADVTVPVQDSSGDGSSRDFTLDMYSYQSSALGVVFVAREGEELESTLENLSKESRDRNETLSQKISITGIGAWGSAVLVTNDGYFLTAAHVAKKVDASLLFSPLEIDFSAESSRVVPGLHPFRIVYRNSEIDLAIIKADLVNAFHTKLRDHRPLRDEPIYNLGGMGDQLSAGRIEKIDNKKRGSHLIYSSTPIVGGDSGSGVFDAYGGLVGIVTSHGWWRNGKIFSRAAMIPKSEILSIIEEDRKSNSINKSIDSTPAVAPQ